MLVVCQSLIVTLQNNRTILCCEYKPGIAFAQSQAFLLSQAFDDVVSIASRTLPVLLLEVHIHGRIDDAAESNKR
jgi:hypothetical protein